MTDYAKPRERTVSQLRETGRGVADVLASVTAGEWIVAAIVLVAWCWT